MRILLAVLALAALVAAKPDPPDDGGAESAAPSEAAATDKPVTGPPADLPARPRPGLREPVGEALAWFDRTGIPRWALAPLLILVLAFLRLIFGGRRRGDDLIGPPPSLRRTSSPRPRRRTQ